MSKVSRYKVSQKDWIRFLDDFYSAVTSLESKQEIRKFLSQVFTRTEEIMLAKRFQIAMLLRLDYGYEEIIKKVKVTSGTIAKVSNLLNSKEGELLNAAVKKIISLKKEKADFLATKIAKNKKTKKKNSITS